MKTFINIIIVLAIGFGILIYLEQKQSKEQGDKERAERNIRYEQESRVESLCKSAVIGRISPTGILDWTDKMPQRETSSGYSVTLFATVVGGAKLQEECFTNSAAQVIDLNIKWYKDYLAGYH